MEEDRKLLVGIDLGKEVTQMHCFDFTSYEPVPIGRKVQGERVYEIPTALAVNPERGEWYWVDEEYAKRDGVICLHYLLADAQASYCKGTKPSKRILSGRDDPEACDYGIKEGGQADRVSYENL